MGAEDRVGAGSCGREVDVNGLAGDGVLLEAKLGDGEAVDDVLRVEAEVYFAVGGEDQFGGDFVVGRVGVGWVEAERVALAGGDPQAVPGTAIPHGIVGSDVLGVSPDGKTLAFLSTVELPGAGLTNVQKIMLVALDAGPSPEIRQLEVNPHIAAGPRFTPDAKSVVYAIRENGVSNLWQQPIDGGPGRQITNFTKQEFINWWRFSPDGKSLGMVRAHVESDAVLLHDNAPAK